MDDAQIPQDEPPFEEETAPQEAVVHHGFIRRHATTIGTGVIALIVGVALGSGPAQKAEDTPEYQKISSELTVSADSLKSCQNEQGTLKDKNVDLEKQVSSLKDTAASATSLQAQLTEAQAALAAAQSSLDQVTAERDSQAQQLEAVNTQAEQAAQDQAPASFYTQPQDTAPVQAPAPSTTTYYKNCDAVRAAGAAPLYAGSPGYSSKLDRDGDGIACE